MAADLISRRPLRSPLPSASKEPATSPTKVDVRRGEIATRRAKFHSVGNGRFVPGTVYEDTASHSELLRMRGYVKVGGVWT